MRYFTIRARSSGSRLAPPTSAPSISGCAMNSRMLPGFTLPPYCTRTDWATVVVVPIGEGRADHLDHLAGIGRLGVAARADRPDGLVGDDHGRARARRSPCRARAGSAGRPWSRCRRRRAPPASRPRTGSASCRGLITARTFLLTIRSSSPKSCRRSEWPTITYRTRRACEHAPATPRPVKAPCVLEGDVLCAEPVRQLVGLDQRLDRAQRRERRADHDLDALGVVLVEQVAELLHGLDRLEVRLVHLPVRGDDRPPVATRTAVTDVLQDRDARAARGPRGTRARRRRRSTGGRTRRRARPCFTAAGESPPPTTLNASALRDRGRDAPGAGAERLELEHAHRAVPQDRLRVGDRCGRTPPPSSARCRGPSGRAGLRRPAPCDARRRSEISVAATTSCGNLDQHAALAALAPRRADLVEAVALARGCRRSRRRRRR